MHIKPAINEQVCVKLTHSCAQEAHTQIFDCIFVHAYTPYMHELEARGIRMSRETEKLGRPLQFEATFEITQKESM